MLSNLSAENLFITNFGEFVMFLLTIPCSPGPQIIFIANFVKNNFVCDLIVMR